MSFILYLGGDSNSDDDNQDMDNCDTVHCMNTSWCLQTEWGALRIYGEGYAPYTNCPLIQVSSDSSQPLESKENTQQFDVDLRLEDKVYADVPPVPGTMVIFDSSKVPHAVMETRRSRRCVVGWLSAPTLH